MPQTPALERQSNDERIKTLPISLALTVSDVGHREATLEAPAHASIDTLGLPPARVFDPHKPVRLMPGELLGPLLDHIELVDGLNTTHD